MIHRDPKKLNLSNQKSSHKNIQKSKSKSVSKPELKANRSISTLGRTLDHKHENQVSSKTQKFKPKLENYLSLDKNQNKKTVAANRKRMVSELILKQSHPKQAKHQQKKSVRYIFNEIPNTRQQPSQTIKLRNKAINSHSKSYSNQSLSKLKSDALSSFGKASNSDFTKIKKKKHDYIKSFAKSSNLEKSLSSGFRSVGCSLNYTQGFKTFDRTALSEYPYAVEDPTLGQELTDDQLQGLQLNSHAPKLAEIRQNVNNLFKKLKSPSKAKLLIISNNYEKIVSDLYTAIQKPNLPNCDISRIDTSNSNSKTNEKENDDPENQKNKSCSKSTNFNSTFQNQRVSAQNRYSEDSSEHWDSYVNLNSQQYLQMNNIKSENGKQSVMKKLNLLNINKPDIKQYQDEFMEMQENFSQSWKRQISQQTRF